MPPELTRVLGVDEIRATAGAIAAVQLPDGCIPWYPGGYADPWDHVEAAMALDAGGLHSQAERAYRWLAATQRPDGSWAHAYFDGRSVEPTYDTNVSTYVAVGVWHHFLATGDEGFLERFWPVVCGAIEFALDLQAPGGEIWWARDARGKPDPQALVTASSCVHLSLRCAIATAERLGGERPDWELSAGSLAHALTHRPQAFCPRPTHAMDWYYPILGGVLTGEAAASHLTDRWETFVVPGLGVRCVSDRPWMTVAETCELVLALDAVGHHDPAVELLSWVQRLRAPNGAYWCGVTFPEGIRWPFEQPTWTSAAVVLAADALAGSSPTSGLFRGDGLPRGLEPSEALSDPA